jgi:GT2 family glycosyltransferase
LNDDTLIDSDAISRFLATYQAVSEIDSTLVILVGCTRDPVIGEITYGGLVQLSRWNPLKLRLCEPSAVPQTVDTMNGNCVMIPMQTASHMGNLDFRFIHAMGDVDYGLRAKKERIGVWTVPGFVGTCSRNPVSGTWQDSNLRLKDRVKRVLSPKGLPPHSWMVLNRKHGGILWPLLFAAPYAKMLVPWRRGH